MTAMTTLDTINPVLVIVLARALVTALLRERTRSGYGTRGHRGRAAEITGQPRAPTGVRRGAHGDSGAVELFHP